MWILIPLLRFIIMMMYVLCRISFGCCGRYTPADVLAVMLSLCIVCVWVMTGHWLLMDGENLATLTTICWLISLAINQFSNSR